MKRKFVLSLFAALIAVALSAAAWSFLPTDNRQEKASLAEYQIEKLTCGSCVSNIEKALATVDGVGSVEVNLTSNRGRITFDPQEVDSQTIAEAISNAGYPARLRLELDPDAYLALQEEQTQLGQDYLAKIGDRLLSRADFDALVNQRSGGALKPSQSAKLLKSVWQDVLQRELLLSAAEQNNVIIQEGEVDLRLNELKEGHKGLEGLVAKRFGSLEAFRERLREDMIINRNIEDHVYAGIEDPVQQRSKLQQWFSALQGNTDVVIFDERLKTLNQGGGGGCGSGGGGCCSS